MAARPETGGIISATDKSFTLALHLYRELIQFHAHSHLFPKLLPQSLSYLCSFCTFCLAPHSLSHQLAAKKRQKQNEHRNTGDCGLKKPRLHDVHVRSNLLLSCIRYELTFSHRWHLKRGLCWKDINASVSERCIRNLYFI